MTKQEFAKLVKGMRAVYGKMFEDEQAFLVWYSLLSDLDYSRAQSALQKYMMTNHFPPTPADIRKNAVDEQEETGALEAWAMVRKAVRNSSYHAEQEYSKLPAAVQKAIGSPANLKELALMPVDTFESVEQSHFVRSYTATQKRIQAERALPEQMRSFTQMIESEKMPMIEEKTPEKPEEKEAASEEVREKYMRMFEKAMHEGGHNE